MKPKRKLFSEEDATLPMPPKGHAHTRFDVDLSTQIEKAVRAKTIYENWLNRTVVLMVSAALLLPAEMFFDRETVKMAAVIILVLVVINLLYYIWQGRK